MNKGHLYLLAVTLSVIGLSLFLYKSLMLNFPLLPNDVVELWDLEARLHFVAEGGAAKVSLSIPSSTRRALLVDERFVSRGFGLTMKKEATGRLATWSRRQAKGEQVLYYRATVQLSAGNETTPLSKTVPAVPPPEFSGSELAAVQSLLDEVRPQSADTETLVTQVLRRLGSQSDASTLLLVGAIPEPQKIVSLASQVLSLANLPSRVAWGMPLFQERLHASPEPWLQVFDSGRWQTFNPRNGEMGLPEDLVLLGYGVGPLLTVEGARTSGVQWSVRRNEEAALSAALQRGRLLSREFIEFSLFSLPLETQQVYRVMLLIPLGAMLLVILRNVIGIKTFGTFMPVLIALAFRETQLLWGVILFVVLVGLGLSIRFYLEHLKLLLVPRLGALLIIVVIMMALVSVISHQLGLERGLSVALFPMVIISMTIERMSIVWEERGAAEAIQQGLGSLLVAVLGYLLMFNRWTEHLLFVFPELLLILLAATLMLGRYSGFRLLELRRFKILAKESD